MAPIITKIIWFVWTTFAPDKAKVELERVAKDLIKVLILLVLLGFAFGALFFVGLYYLAQWLIMYIHYPIISYFIAAAVCLFFTVVGILALFRYIIFQFIKRAHNKGNGILNAFTLKK